MVGRDAILDFYANERVIAHGRHVIDKVICEGNNVAVEGFFTGTLRKGPTVEVRFSDFFVFENGLISMRRTYFSVSAV